MNYYSYRVYYEFHEPSLSDPFATRKSPEEVNRALVEFPKEFTHRLPDRDAEIRTTALEPSTTQVILSATTTASEEQFTSALSATLREWRLLAEPSRSGTGVA